MSLFNSAKSSAPSPLRDNPPAMGGPSSSGSPDPAQAGFSLNDVQRALPGHLRTQVTQQLVDTLNNVAADPLMAEQIRNNFVSYSAILKEGKFKTEDYLNAVAYVSYKLMGYTNQDAWTRTFPNRHHLLVSRGTSAKDIAAHVSAYNRGKLVNLILEQTLVPSWVLNQDLYQKAINVQADLMFNAQSEKVKQEAANSLLTHLAKPKENNLQINIGETESAGMKEMRGMLSELAENQRKAIAEGSMKTVDVAASRIRKDETNE